MSPPSNANLSSNRPGQHAGVNDLQTSNRTSGHFLGTVPREWMLHKGNADATSVTANAALPTRRYTLGDALKDKVTVQNTLVDGPLDSQTPRTSDAVQSTVDRPTLPRAQSDRHIDTTSSRVPNINRNAFSSNSGGVQSEGGQNASIPTPNDSPINQPSAFVGNSVILASMSNTVYNPPHDAVPVSTAAQNNNNNFGVSTSQHGHPAPEFVGGDHIDFTDISTFRPTTWSPQIPQLSTPNMSPTIAVNRTSTVPAKRPRGRPPGTRQITFLGPSILPSPPIPQTPPPIPQTPPSGSFVHSQPAMVAQPDLLLRLNGMKEKLLKTNNISSVDAIRFRWLHGACRVGDQFYVLLHQLTCIWTRHPSLLSTNLGFLPEHTKGLDVLSYILADNRQVSSEALAFFCNFTRPLQSLTSDRSAGFMHWVKGAKHFLQILVKQWQSLHDQVFLRKCPPSAREVAETLGLDSTVLSQAIYMHFCHGLVPRWTSSFMEESFSLFLKSQEYLEYRTRSGIFGTTQDPDVHQEESIFRASFYGLVRTLHQPSIVDVSSTNPGVNSNAAARHDTSSAQPTVAQNSGVATNRLLPVAGQLLPIIVNPTPHTHALHQAHLFDPCMEFDRRGEDLQRKGRMYSFLERLTGDLQVIDTTTVFKTWSILIPTEIFQRRVQDLSPPKEDGFGRTTRLAHSRSIMFYLRCIQLRPDVEILSEVEYSAEATSWPQHVFISMNGVHLEFRRKIHHGRDLPVDVTHIIQEENNELKLSYHPNPLEIRKGKRFAIGLEAVVILDHDTVFQMPSLLEAEESKGIIIEQVQRSDIEDDIVMADTHVSIDLIDPFTARIFEHPVRGTSCRHRECFDLEAFLQSRNCRNKDNFVHADEWKCPICGKDARPFNLVIDGFLLQVKQRLLADGRLDTKAILVKEDGTWMPKTDMVSRAITGRGESSAEPQRSEISERAKDVRRDADISATDRQIPATLAEPIVIILEDEDDDD